MAIFNFSRQLILKLFVISYASIFFIGELSTMDRLAPQTFSLNILNFVALFYIFFNVKESKKSVKLFHGLFNPNSIYLYYSLIFLSMVFSLLFTINLTESLISLSHYFNLIISLFCISVMMLNIKELKIFFLTLVSLIFLIETSYVFYKIIDYYITYDVYGSWGRTFEIRGFTGNINITAFTLVYKLPFILYFLIEKFKNKTYVIVTSIFILITIINIFHLGSRGGILSLFLILGLYTLYLIFNFKYVAIYLSLISLIALSTSYYILKDSEISNPIKRTSTININTNDGSINQRIRYYKEIIEYVGKNPFKPIGVGMYKLKSIEFEKDEISQYIVPVHSHNDFLEILIENGIVSLLCYVLIFISLIKRVLLQLFSKNNLYYLPILSFLGVYFLDSFLNFPMARPVSFLFFNLITAFIINDSKG